MKVISKQLEKNKSGYIKLIAEDNDDLWNVYNLICPADCVEASTLRRIQIENTSGAVDNSTRLRINLTIKIESIKPDLQSGLIHVNGKTVVESKHVKLGSYHTLDLELNHPIKIFKEYWDSVTLEMLKEASELINKAEIAAVTVQEGYANIILITETTTSVVQKLEVNIPKKRMGSTTSYDKAVSKFHQSIYSSLLRNVKLNEIKAVLIASPGFYKDQLFDFIMKNAQKDNNRLILDNKKKFVLLHSSSGHKAALIEALQDPSVQSTLSSTKFMKQSKMLDAFFSTLSKDPCRAYYGYKHVEAASELGAISSLLVADELFRSSDVMVRRKYVNIVETVKRMGGDVYIYSTNHHSGEQLRNLTGIAAILTYSIPEIEDIDDFTVVE